ncbi:secretin N-terminal domain-containing protein, partial [Malonomonas rubra]|uniref:secretin N-terminal domain-containing protein n=1 Tax=Malonomonas rubra TaxID=57040 RepID=UPI0026EDD099
MNKHITFLRLIFLGAVAVILSGCSGYFAYQEGLDLDAEGRFGESTTKFYEAVKEDPDNIEYRIQLQKSREMAAYEAVKDAEQLESEGRLQEALVAYDKAYSFDPSQDVARLKHVEIQRKIDLQMMVNDGEQLFRERKIALARQIVTQVLNMDPDFKPAQDLSARVSAVHKTMVAGQELELSSSEPITLKFKKTDIKDAFSVISRLSGITFIYDEDIRSKTFTVFLEQATFAQALELLLRLNQLEMKVLNPKTILIYPNTRDKKKQYEDQLVQIFYLSNIDAKKAVNLLRTMLTLRKVYVHEELNALVVRDTPVAINLARQILESADRADSEVVYELELLSVTVSDDMTFGPALSTYGGQVGIGNKEGNIIANAFSTESTAAVTTTGLINSLNGLEGFYTLPSASFAMTKAANDTELLANPRVRVKNMEKAKVHIGTREPVITVTTSGTDQVSENVQYVDTGIKLDVEPDIQLDGTIVTKVSLEVSEGAKVEYTGIKSVPLRITTTNASTVLTLKDGEQTIIGGLLRKDKTEGKTGLPFLSDIPLIGWLLSRNT